MKWTDFFLGVTASVVAAAVVGLATTLFASSLRNRILRGIASILGAELETRFANPRAAQDDVIREIRDQPWVWMLTSRGNELQRETYAPLLADRIAGRRVEFRILLPNCRPRVGEPDYAHQRELELAQFDQAFGHGVLKDQIDTTLRFLLPHVRSGHVTVRLYNLPHLARILLTPKCAYLTPYRNDAHGRDSVVLKFAHGSENYRMLKRFFELAWEHSIVAE